MCYNRFIVNLYIVMCGIYKITNKINNKVYVGKTKNTFKRRWDQHKYKLRRGNSTCTYLQNAWNKYGEESFDFSIIAEGDFNKEELAKLETIFIRLYGNYNLKDVDTERCFASSTLKKISKNSKKMWESQEHRDYMKKVHTKQEHWNKLPQVREYWRDKRNGRGGNAHPGKAKIMEKFNIPRGICQRMLAHLKAEDVDTVEIDKQLIYEYWNDNSNVPESNRSRWTHPGYRNISEQFNISYYQSKQLIKEFSNFGF